MILALLGEYLGEYLGSCISGAEIEGLIKSATSFAFARQVSFDNLKQVIYPHSKEIRMNESRVSIPRLILIIMNNNITMPCPRVYSPQVSVDNLQVTRADFGQVRPIAIT